eukprot:TRINITY_DN13004_c0_g1_i1.p1 TRINITY_DN13004_c0_g1~~TRINITY_DN13004_c0_g1_i1.p1  ORF type:complete len:132 (-),score=49.55 TRINITY_DN13004_c0_g1_i1:186-581(-)
MCIRDRYQRRVRGILGNTMASRTSQVKLCFQAAFKRADKDGSDFLEKGEIEAAAVQVLNKFFELGGAAPGGQSAEEMAAEFLATVDTNHDGKVSFDEVWGKFVAQAGTHIDEDPGFDEGFAQFKEFLDAIQ